MQVVTLKPERKYNACQAEALSATFTEAAVRGRPPGVGP